MKSKNRILAIPLILLALAVAAFGVWLCAYALRSEPYFQFDESGPKEALEDFFSRLQKKDWNGAYAHLYNYSSLGFEAPPEDALSAMFWEAQQSVWRFSVLDGQEMSGTSLVKNVSVRCLNLDAVSDRIGERVQAYLEEKVESAALRSDVYNEDGSYREDVAYEALHAAAREVLADTAPFCYEQTLPLRLYYVNGDWLIEVSPALLSALTGGAVRR